MHLLEYCCTGKDVSTRKPTRTITRLMTTASKIKMSVNERMSCPRECIIWCSALARSHRLLGVEAFSEMDWKRYSLAFAAFGIVNMVVLYFFLRWQVWLPCFFPEVMTTPLTPDLAANTAVSFATTTWQAYPGESTMSYFSQLLLTLQNFLAGAAGLAVGIAFIRGYAREETTGLGNFWGDLIRALLWVLLPPTKLVSGVGFSNRRTRCVRPLGRAGFFFYERPDCFENSTVNVILAFTVGFELSFRDEQGVIATFDDVQFICGPHLPPDFGEPVQRAKRIACSLHEQDRRPQFAQHLVAQLGGIAAAAERVAEANERCHFFLQREVVANPRAHALADEHDPAGVRLT
jgi:Potassium-transporting ATPase A subunit